jgi:dUTPase
MFDTVYVLVPDLSFIKTGHESHSFDMSFRIARPLTLEPGNSYSLTTGVRTFSTRTNFLMVPRSSSGRLLDAPTPSGQTGLLPSILHQGEGFPDIRTEAAAGIRLANTLGVIDWDYRGEWKAWVQADYNNSNRLVTLQPGKFYLQAVPLTPCNYVFTDNISDIPEALRETSRGEGGFGSSGK